MNGKSLIPFVVSLSNHERNLINQRFPKWLIFQRSVNDTTELSDLGLVPE